MLPDPWVEVQRIHNVGETIKVQITRLVPFGAFVAVEGGVEGIIPNAELAHRRVNKPEDVELVGDEVEVKVLGLPRKKPSQKRKLLKRPKTSTKSSRI